jgi:hypothetical protein
MKPHAVDGDKATGRRIPMFCPLRENAVQNGRCDKRSNGAGSYWMPLG